MRFLFHVLLVVLFAPFLFSMDDQEFKETFSETLNKKYGITARDYSSTGQGFLRDAMIEDENFPRARLWVMHRPNNLKKNVNIDRSYKNLGINFFGPTPEQVKIELQEFALKLTDLELYHFKTPVVEVKSWAVLLTNNPCHVEQSKKTIELIYSWGLISNGLYNYLIAELGIGDMRYQNIRPLIRRIVKSLPGLPLFEDVVAKAKNELVGNVVLLDTFMAEIKNPNSQDEFLNYLMDDYYLSLLRTTNFPMLMKNIERKIPPDSSDEVIHNVILNELLHILDKENRDRMTFKLVKKLMASIYPTPDYLIDLCSLISKDGEYHRKASEIKSQLVFVRTKNISQKERYGEIIRWSIEFQNNEINTFVKVFINDGALESELPSQLQNLDYSHDSFMNLLDYIRELHLTITKMKKDRPS